jgi:hypothetical protein
MAKMAATENAQRVIDMALQMHGGLGVKVGTKVESLYRDIRSLRIYEGATEVQQLIIGKSVLKGGHGSCPRRPTVLSTTACRPREQLPQLRYDLPELQLPGAAQSGARTAGQGGRQGLRGPADAALARSVTLTYAQAASGGPHPRRCWCRTWGWCPATGCCCAAATRSAWRWPGWRW